MKRFLLILQILLFSLISFAQLSGDGYYRVKNVASERYITVKDNRGSINIQATTADLGAVELYKGFENVVSDPGSILYISQTSAGYKFYSQGTDTYEIIGYYLKMMENSDGSYKAYQGNSYTVMYLGDKVTSPAVKGRLATNAKGQYRDWYILPVSASSDNYFGLSPEVKTIDSYYASFYASFPFTVVSKDMQVFYIDKVDNGMAVYKEVANGIVPNAMPVFVKCVSESPADNRLDIISNSVSTISNNKLAGVYFCNDNDDHLNRIAYDAETMRVLGTAPDGSLAFIKVNYDFLPANKSYLTVPQGSPDVIKVVSEEEYQNSIQGEQKTFIVTFKIDGKILSSQTLMEGDVIGIPNVPEKDGYTFSGWGDVPATMPRQNLTFEGTYIANTYTLCYVVDGNEFQRIAIEYGETISLIAHPEKEGRTFSGWSEVPETMPAHDVEVEGCFMYKVFYYVNGALVNTEEAFYGSEMPEYVYQPTEEGVTFLGWEGETYETMPAYDVTYTANIEGSSVELIASDAFVDVYTITGTKVMSRVSLDEAKRFLKRGIYIVNGKKMIVE